MRVPMINAREWRAIAPHLPPTGGPGKPQSDDRLMVSAFFYAEACKCSLDSLPAAYGNPRSRCKPAGGVGPRRHDDPKLMEAGAPAIQRMHRIYWGTDPRTHA